MSTASHVDTMRRSSGLTAVLGTITFPAAREDLLLHAIATHATPSLIADIRSLAPSWFEDEAAVRNAIGAL